MSTPRIIYAGPQWIPSLGQPEMSDEASYRLSHNPFGRLVFTEANGAAREGVVPVRAFPITAPGGAIALVDQHGHELAWIEQLSDLPDELREIVEAELATREFI